MRDKTWITDIEEFYKTRKENEGKRGRILHIAEFARHCVTADYYVPEMTLALMRIEQVRFETNG